MYWTSKRAYYGGPLLSKINLHNKNHAWISNSSGLKIPKFENNPPVIQNNTNWASTGGDFPVGQNGLSSQWNKSIFVYRFSRINTTRFDMYHLYFAFDFRTVSSKMVIKADQTRINTAFLEVPMNNFIRRFCFTILKKLCKASHNFFKESKQLLN